MLQLLRNISTVVLASAYLIVAQATIEHLTSAHGSGSGHAAINALCGKTKEPTRAVWTQRQHLPLVHQFGFSAVVSTDLFRFASMQEFDSLEGFDHPREYCSLYFSSFCNKAPPVS